MIRPVGYGDRRMARPLTRRHDVLGRSGPLLPRVAPMGTGLATLWLAAGLIEAVLSWSGHAFDALRYGTPRTSQADGAIGQDRARAIAVHLTAENIDRRIWITILPKTERGPILMIRGPQLLGARRDRPYPRVAMRSSAGKAQIELRIEDRSITYSYDPRHHTFTLPSDEPGGRR